MVGYVHTKVGWPGPITGYRPYKNATDDIDKWSTTYSVDGIFVDEVSNLAPTAPWDNFTVVEKYYGNLTNYI